jgi:hypothetical protein
MTWSVKPNFSGRGVSLQPINRGINGFSRQPHDSHLALARFENAQYLASSLTLEMCFDRLSDRLLLVPLVRSLNLLFYSRLGRLSW